MTQPILISSFLPETILENTLVHHLPEYYQLKDVIESQGWHDNQSVFDHSIDSARSLKSITQFDDLESIEQESLVRYLQEIVDVHTRMELLMVATLLHDIGKLISLQHNAEGNTNSPSHGVLGSWVARPLLDRFELTSKEKLFILTLISDHLVPSDLIEMSINNGTNSQQVVDLLKAHRPESSVELLLLAYADWMGCDIQESVQEERDKRVVIVHECLSGLAIAR